MKRVRYYKNHDDRVIAGTVKQVTKDLVEIAVGAAILFALGWPFVCLAMVMTR
jgi:hypothetical protein